MLLFLAAVACGPVADVVGVVEPVTGVDGGATWSVEWDEEATGLGLEPCEYSRAYSGWEDHSVPWLCADCEEVYRLDVTLEGLGCYQRIVDDLPESVEWHGSDGASWLRAVENYPLLSQGTVDTEGDAARWHHRTEWYDAPDSGRFRLSVEGRFEFAEIEADPWFGARPPGRYRCGWSSSGPRAYDGDWRLAEGRTLPDGFFRDQCGDTMRLHDMVGTWFVLEASAVDCGPCRDMAEGEEAWIASMKRSGVDVQVVTLLAPALGDPLGPLSPELQAGWVQNFGLQSPVLADRGYGIWTLGAALGDDFSWPAWAVVAPDLEVVALGTGFGGWQRFETYIE